MPAEIKATQRPVAYQRKDNVLADRHICAIVALTARYANQSTLIAKDFTSRIRNGLKARMQRKLARFYGRGFIIEEGNEKTYLEQAFKNAGQMHNLRRATCVY